MADAGTRSDLGLVAIPASDRGLSLFLRLLGPGYLVAVGSMDSGNWATDLAAGSGYGYGLLWVVALSSLMAVLLQTLCCRLGIATGSNLAQACARLLPAAWRLPLWLLAEIGIIASDLAELVGTALALQLLFDLPLALGWR
jgi:manganese transport protein